MDFFYSVSIRLYLLLVRVASFLNPKAKQWLEGRKIKVENNSARSIWFHCASLGEYKQALPLIERIEKTHPNITISFFSPSGYDKVVTKHKKCYLPPDLKREARKFIQAINPELAIFVKYEFWFNHLTVLHELNIPVTFINAVFHPKQYFFQFPFKFLRDKFKRVSKFYLVDEGSKEVLNSHQILNTLVIGDTKYDQVYMESKKHEETSFKKLNRHKPIFLLASIEKGDCNIICHTINKFQNQYQFILVPHDPQELSQQYFQQSINADLKVYSSYKADQKFEVLFVDQFGILPQLYSAANISYIGGGFNQGIHNILEACIYQIPMLFGPKHHKFLEAQQLVNLGAAKVIENIDACEPAIIFFQDDLNIKNAQTNCDNFISENLGATNRILEDLALSGVLST